MNIEKIRRTLTIINENDYKIKKKITISYCWKWIKERGGTPTSYACENEQKIKQEKH